MSIPPSQPAPRSDQNPDFIWDLRLVHEAGRSLRLERQGRCIRFDPLAAPAPADIAVLTGPWPASLSALSAAVRSASQPTLVAEGELRAWLEGQGPVKAVKPPCLLDGMQIELRAAPPPPAAEPADRARELALSALAPARAVARLYRRSRLPSSAPQVARVTFPSGRRLLHVGLALHGATPAPWLETLVGDWSAPDWLILGAAWGHEEAALGMLRGLKAGKVVLTDLIGEERQERGLSSRLLTPLVDALRRDGVDAYVLVHGASMRFE